MKKYLEDGTEIEVALFAKNPAGKTIVVATDFVSETLTDEQKAYTEDELGATYEVYSGEI